MRPTPHRPCGRDVPAPSIAARPRPANRGQPAFPVLGRRAARLRDVHDVGTTTHPKANVVVTVVGRVVVALGSATVVRIVVPGPAAQHTGQVSGSPADRCLQDQCGSEEQRAQKYTRAALCAAQWSAARRFSAQRGGVPRFDGGTTTHPKADEVVTEVGPAAVAVGSATAGRTVIPGTAAPHAESHARVH